METKEFLQKYGTNLYRGYWCGGGDGNYKQRKSTTDPKTLDHALNNFVWLLGALKDNVIIVDFDDPEAFECALKIAKANNEHCVVIKSSKGGHFYYYDTNHVIMKSNTKMKTLLTFYPVDYKLGYKIIDSTGEIKQAGNYACLSKEDKTLREVVYYNFKDDGTLDEIPYYHQRVNSSEKYNFLNMAEGDGRNDLFHSYMIPVKNSGFTYEQYSEAMQLVNKFLLKDSISGDEFETVIRQEEWEKVKGHKKEVSPESFNCFLLEKGLHVRYNELLNIVEFGNIPKEHTFTGIKDIQNQMPTALQYSFRKYVGLKNITKQQTIDLISLEADKNSYNPVKDYLQNTAWDGKDRFPELFEVLGVQNSFEQNLIRKWFYQSAAMPFNKLENPIQPEGVLIFQGDEGIGKTRFFSKISVNPLWFKSLDKSLSTKNKDILIETLSAWITEIGEIDHTFTERRSDLKSFMTAEKDTIRKPYAREPIIKARTTSICGTTNKMEFLNDETGLRRWWVVHIPGKIYLDEFVKPDNLHQFWAQCYEISAANPLCFRLSDDERNHLTEENKSVTEMLPAEDELRLRFDFDAPENEWFYIQASALKILPEFVDVSNYDTRVIGKAIAKISKDYPKIEYKKHKGVYKWFVPPAITNTNRFRN